MSSKVAALPAHHGCQLRKNIGNFDERGSVEAADEQNAMLAERSVQQE
jgi:hypothetical protein